MLGKGEDSLDLSNHIPYADISGAPACVRIVPNNTAVDDNWVMRNISIAYRTAPLFSTKATSRAGKRRKRPSVAQFGWMVGRKAGQTFYFTFFGRPTLS